MITAIILNIKLILIFVILVVNGKLSKKIHGGTRVPIDYINFQVSIQMTNAHICSGTIISDIHILTSATCVTLNNNVVLGNIEIRSGSNYIDGNHSSDVTFSKVSLVIYHPDYNMFNFWINDICILKLTTKLTIEKWNRNFANLLRDRITKATLYVSGWGGQFGGVIPDLDVDPTQHLQRINIKRVHQMECMDIFKRYFHENQHCAYTIPKGTTHITLGDSGSPVLAYRKVFGIISVVSDIDYAPFIYTKIYSYIDWIDEMLIKY